VTSRQPQLYSPKWTPPQADAHFPTNRILLSTSILDIDSMPKADNLQGSLELLVMKILRRGPNHGFALSSYIQQTSDEILRVEAGSLYPALHRMTEAGLLKAEWRMSEAGRRARFYSLTAKGRRRLEEEKPYGDVVQDRENLSGRPPQRRHSGGASVPPRYGCRRRARSLANPFAP